MSSIPYSLISQIMSFKRFWFTFNLTEGGRQSTREISRRGKETRDVNWPQIKEQLYFRWWCHLRKTVEGKSQSRQTIQSRYRPLLFNRKSAIFTSYFQYGKRGKFINEFQMRCFTLAIISALWSLLKILFNTIATKIYRNPLPVSIKHFQDLVAFFTDISSSHIWKMLQILHKSRYRAGKCFLRMYAI